MLNWCPLARASVIISLLTLVVSFYNFFHPQNQVETNKWMLSLHGVLLLVSVPVTGSPVCSTSFTNFNGVTLLVFSSGLLKIPHRLAFTSAPTICTLSSTFNISMGMSLSVILTSPQLKTSPIFLLHALVSPRGRHSLLPPSRRLYP